MKKRFLSSWAKLGVVVVLAGAAAVYGLLPPVAKVESAVIGEGVRVTFKTNGTQIEQFRSQQWQPYFAKGVNMGAAVPGHFPGELAITADDYMRWFEMIQDMGANVIRVYTILQPEFYESLVRYNAKHQEQPLFFIQGVWSPEEELIEGKNAYDPVIKQRFEKEIREAVEAVYGNIELQAEPHSGKASGNYLFNAGPYLMGWIIGTEWDPVMVDQTNKGNPEVTAYKGRHFQSRSGASPFEAWLAEMVDLTAVTEAKHGWQHPIAFSNWVTTDPLEHPGEPLVAEDMVSVDPTHIEAVDWDAGYFASYHVYPYYPDFFTFDASFQTMKNDRGEIDSYKTYLHKLKAYHNEMPIMITEFGVPASQGIAHTGMLGRNQGGHDDKTQGEMDAEMFRQIHQEGYSGAILFTWQDEWFKKTWNTMKYDIPDRRAYWYNTLTNESHFGLLGMYPGKDDVLHIDGDDGDWDKLAPKDKTRLDMQVEGFDELWAAHDEGYLYVLAKLSEPFDSSDNYYFGFDTMPGGNRHAPQLQGRTLDEGLETLLELGRGDAGRMMVASNYDVHTRMYGKEQQMLDVAPEELEDDSGIFKPWKLVVSYLLEPPDARAKHPFTDIEVGEMLRGNSNPDDPNYHSKAMWQAKGQVLEIRIPWMLLGFSDPSSLQAINYEDTGTKSFASSVVDGIRIMPWVARSDAKGSSSTGEATYPVSQLPLYTWSRWEDVDVRYVERPKQSYGIMKQAMHEVQAPAGGS
ncbi:hypothetical protein [Paenibacillus sp. SYP-B4298]|uniref:hypothetical protein n=1 Tax=Paenibacillus sp. SYP-B4298 TaxID=2996034 RepID=UPI0022DDDA93|nr:hypothetical protein [Paenibacillus sp. SYP-B4298]